MMAFLIEAYKANGAITLAREFSLQELNLLLSQTVELRRDPEERKAEVDRETGEKWMKENRNRVVEFRSADGKVKNLDMSMFQLTDE